MPRETPDAASPQHVRSAPGEGLRRADALQEARLELAAQLHDGPLQLLESARQDLDEDDPGSRRRGLRLLAVADRELRALLTPSDAGGSRSRQGLDDWCALASARRPFTWSIEVGDELRETDRLVFSAARELITNAARHSGCAHLQVRVSSDATSHLVDVRDDGRGFARNAEPGYGLSSLSRRLASAGGTWTRDEPPGGGAHVHVRLPRTSSRAATPDRQTAADADRSLRAHGVREHLASGRDHDASTRDGRAVDRDRAAVMRASVVQARDREVTARVHELGGVGASPLEVDETTRLLAGMRAAWADDSLLTATDQRAAAHDRADAAEDRRLATLDRLGAATDRATAADEHFHDGIDGLTGAFLRGSGTLALQHEVDRARRTGDSLVLLMLDVDDLKAANDAGGHARGDAVLRDVAVAVLSTLRSYDVLVRWGGDEFVCALSEMDLDASAPRIAQMREALAARRPGATVSCGVVELEAGEPLDAVIGRADAALYEDKRRRALPGRG